MSNASLDQLVEVTKRNAITSSLLKLPAELRNQIYELVFKDSLYDLTRIALKARQAPPAPLSSSQRMSSKIMKARARGPVSKLGLLQACRQIYTEVKHLPLALGTLYFSHIGDVDLLVKKLTTDQRCAISSLQFNLERAMPGLDDLMMAYRHYFRHQLERLHAMPDLPNLKRLHVQVGPQGLDNCTINDMFLGRMHRDKTLINFLVDMQR